MPLYVRGTVSFGTVVATPGATAGDSAFVILALAPRSRTLRLRHRLRGLRRDRLPRRRSWTGRLAGRRCRRETLASDGRRRHRGQQRRRAGNPAHDYGGPAPTHAHESGPDRHSRVLTPLSHLARPMVGSRHLGAHLWKPLPAPRAVRGRAVARPRLRRTVHRHRHRRRGPVAVPLRRHILRRRKSPESDSFGSVYDTRSRTRRWRPVSSPSGCSWPFSSEVLRPLQRGANIATRRGGGDAGTDRRRGLSG